MSPRSVAFLFAVVLPLCAAAQIPGLDPKIKLGVDVLIERGFEPLKGKRVGLITNPTGMTRDLRATVDVLCAAKDVQLVALYGPEHGVRGEAPAGAHVEDLHDAATGLPVFSLYGATRKPSEAMLRGIDVLVFDIQDIGARSYTYISTMTQAMEAAAEQNLEFIVLDRPNPIGGNRVEGRVLNMQFRSFVGYLPVPYLHGMTVGELAQMINGEGWLPNGAKCRLTLVPIEGWRRDMDWADTGLVWVPTSPHVPRADSAYFYAATGIYGELQVLSEGVGYPLPFELAGAPDLGADAFARELASRSLPGVFFRPAWFRPYYTRLTGKTCGGVQIHLLKPKEVELTALAFHLMDAARKVNPEMKVFGNGRDEMFDKVCGTDAIRKAFEADRPLEEILGLWREGVESFRTQRAPYLLYH